METGRKGRDGKRAGHTLTVEDSGGISQLQVFLREEHEVSTPYGLPILELQSKEEVPT